VLVLWHGARIAPPGDEQCGAVEFRQVHGFDRIAQSFARPPGPRKKDGEIVFFEPESGACVRPRIGRHGEWGHAIVDHLDLRRRILEVLDDFLTDKCRIGDDRTRSARTEEFLFERKDFTVFAAEAPEPPLPCRLEFRPPLQPRRVHAVAGAIGIAGVNALEAEEEIASVARAKAGHRVRKGGWGTTDDGHVLEWPLPGRPLLAEEHDRVASLGRRLSKAPQIRFRAPGAGIAATHETDLH